MQIRVRKRLDQHCFMKSVFNSIFKKFNMSLQQIMYLFHERSEKYNYCSIK